MLSVQCRASEGFEIFSRIGIALLYLHGSEVANVCDGCLPFSSRLPDSADLHANSDPVRLDFSQHVEYPYSRACAVQINNCNQQRLLQTTRVSCDMGNRIRIDSSSVFHIGPLVSRPETLFTVHPRRDKGSSTPPTLSSDNPSLFQLLSETAKC